MPNITVKIEGLDRFRRALAEYPKIAAEFLQRAINATLITIEGKAKTKAPVGVTGALRNRWNIVAKPLSGSLTSGVKYSTFVEKGTRPHWPPWKGAKGRGLQQWARSKGIPVFLVARSIAKKGTKAHPFLEPAVRDSVPAMERFLRDALHDTMEEIARRSR
ncbi:HK97 gp10 family phage protein [Candidatus Woesearchaeota archaeon]|nr:HK97 gp10 family phage protein [Candidatus Woesearchaeota archaeon]